MLRDMEAEKLVVSDTWIWIGVLRCLVMLMMNVSQKNEAEV